MKFAVSILLLAVFCQAEEVRPSRSKQKEDSKTDKRALVEGNAGVEKRAPVIATALPSPTPGIEYADTNQIQDKSPQQQVYATPLPQLAKISDLLSGQGHQGHQFQAAIASHLFSPVSIYQTRLPGYEVSAPIPSKLAYTEKITYQPQTADQFTPQVFKQPQKQANFITVPYPQPVEQYQQIPPQQLQQHQYQQLQAPQIRPVQYQQIQPQPQFIQIQPYHPAPVVYNQQPFQYQSPVQLSPQPVAYVQQQLPANVQPGIIYTRGDENTERPIQKELNPQQQQVLQNLQEKPEQKYNDQNQGAVSYASFSVGSPATQPQHNQQYQRQIPQYQTQQQYQPQQQQVQPQQVQFQRQQLQNHQYQIQRQPLPQFSQQIQAIQYQTQPQQQQIHHQIQPQIVQKPEPASANSVNILAKPVPLSAEKEQLYYRPESIYQPQVYHGQELVAPNHLPSQQVLAVPTFPPVQYFGKFAHELFRNYQHN